MTDSDRVRAPRDSHAAPARLDRADAEAEATRVLAGYRSRRGGVAHPVARRGRGLRWLGVAALALAGAALGALAGAVHGQALPAAAGLGLAGLLLGWIATRR